MESVCRFQSEPVQRLIQDILSRTLKDKTYSPDATPEWTKTISQEIMTNIKSTISWMKRKRVWGRLTVELELNYDRYKIVVDVTIGEVKGQGVRCASRCLWDTETDSYATGTFKNVDSLQRSYQARKID